ncbi:type III N6-adenine DNA methyltransferase subunit M [Thermosynechococcus sp. NK55a]|uniref:site-specific DNA-methyltransferase n=1 Tax=Thermosynechococcus sp. NK55a TaxID=1394889 RepID=UPI0003D7B4BF|nr:site-specific DNA-methyltransferase [Thermosynechococcus sp. NK55a]AHB88527.1 type III N6-adenine DNA methyltransferase subunit M [Thermosynechococcus sp. NK55a]
MPRKKQSSSRPIASYEHRDKERLNNPLVGLVTPETDPDAGQKKKRYAYDPHLDPQLVWAGKAEHTSFEVPTVSLHVHERIEPRTIIEAVRKDSGQWSVASGQLSLFEEERKEPLREAIEFYQHRHGWSNRLIAGDSLLVMNSLLEKEGMAGKVQMIYIDPPYGIKYGSNFQPFVNKRDVKDGKDEDLTAEPEQIRAFRDTWELGIHSYLTYLRDRLLLARELLTESGSIFVQISDENVHHVRELMDEVFGAGNFCAVIAFKKTVGQTSQLLAATYDFVLWYAKDRERVKFRPLYRPRTAAEDAAAYPYAERADGSYYRIKEGQIPAADHRIFGAGNTTSQTGSDTSRFDFDFEGKTYKPSGAGRGWTTSLVGLQRLASIGRLLGIGNTLVYKRYATDFPHVRITATWEDTVQSTFAVEKLYVVQTGTKVIERCLLMTTDPGDLVFDPTCGSGTTAYVAEKWGRRWITCDTSRVALTLARQRLMTAVFDYYELAHPEEGVGSGFKYKTVPHVTLKSIANNPEIDGIHARWAKRLEEFLVSSFEFLERERVQRHLEKAEFGLLEQYIRDAAKSDPQLDTKNSQLKTLLAQRRADIDAAIARHAPQETLYDQPFVDRKKVRVTGPFTVEAVPAPAVKSPEEILEDKPQPADTSIARSGETLRQAEWRDELLRTGIRGKAGQYIRFARLEPLPGCRWLHADGETRPSDEGADRVRETAPAYDPMRVVVSFGPEHAPLEQRQVAHAIEEAQTLVPKPKLIVFAAFQFDPEAAKDIDEMKPELAGMQFLKVQMNADLLTEDLKKKRASNESFWLIGQPDVEVRREKDGKYVVEVHGFDYYNTKTGQIESGGADKIAVWMLDTDYDGRSLYPRQVFFPMAGENEGWAKLARNLKAEIDAERIEAYRGTVSLPFEPGEHKRIAVKIVDDRGIESMKVMELS